MQTVSHELALAWCFVSLGTILLRDRSPCLPCLPQVVYFDELCAMIYSFPDSLFTLSIVCH